jgi:rhamnosyltransferase
MVLLAAHNGSQWILEQVDSILEQVGVDVTLIISDDGSTDDTRSRLTRYSNDSRVHIISPASPTGAAAQNFFWLMRNASGDGHAFIALADQDDIWSIDKLQRACIALGNSGAGGYSCSTKAFWRDGRGMILRQAERLTRSDFLFESAGQGCTYVLTAGFYTKVRDFLRLSFVDTSSVHYHDWAIYALSRLWGVGWKFDPQPMLQYRQHGGNDTGARSSFSGVRKRINRIRAGWYAEQLCAIARLSIAAAPGDPMVAEWNKLLQGEHGIEGRLRRVLFCLRGGRRRRTDQIILLLSAMAGWV